MPKLVPVEETNRGRLVPVEDSPVSPRLVNVSQDRPTPPATLAQKLSDPTYIPSKSEWKQMKEDGKAKTVSFREAAGIVKQAFTDAASAVGHGVAETGKSLAQGRFSEIGQSYAESLARGTLDMGILGQQIAQSIPKRDFSEGVRTVKTSRGRVIPAGNRRRGAKPQAPTEEMVSKREDREYSQYVTLRKAQAIRHLATTGQENLLDQFLGETNQINQKIAEGGSYWLDPTLAAGVATGLAPKIANKAAEKILKRGGKAVRQTGEVVENAAAKATDKVHAAVQEMLPGMEQFGGRSVRGLQLGTAAAAGATLPPELLGVAGAGVAGVRGTRGAGAFTEAVGQSVGRQPSQIGVFEGLAKDTDISPTLRGLGRTLHHLGGDRLEPIARHAIGGAVSGSLVGAGLGGLAGGVEGALAGLGEGLFSGGLGGTIGAGTSTLTGKRRVQAENNDINNFRRHLESRSINDVNRFNELKRSTQLQMATVQAAMPDINLELVNDATFRVGHHGPASSKAYYDPNTKTIRVNSQSKNLNQDFMHEVGHAIFDSPIVDKTEIAVELDRLYGQEGIKQMGLELIKRKHANERTGTFDGDADAVLTEELLADPQFIIKELFAETFMDITMDEAFNRLRKGKTTAYEQGPLHRAWIKAKGDVLSRLGVIPEASGYLPLKQTQFGSDVRLKHDRRFAKMLRKYVKDVDTFYGRETKASKIKHKGAKVTLQNLATAPYAGWVARPDGSFENDFAILKDGKVTPKDGKEIQATIERRREDVSSLIAQSLTNNPELRVEDLKGILDVTRGIELDPNVRELSPRMAADGRRIVTGSVLPENIYDLQSFSPEHKAIMREWEAAVDRSDVYSGWYQAIGTSRGEGSWRQSVQKNLGNLRVRQTLFKPFGFQLSKEGNLVGLSLDVGLTLEKMTRWKNQGKFGLWENNLRSVREDMFRYLRNHAEGRPGADGIGEAKRDVLNALFGVAREGANDMQSLLNAGEGGTSRLIRGFRIDRLHSLNKTGRDGFFFDPEKQAINYRTKPDPDSQLTQRGIATLETYKKAVPLLPVKGKILDYGAGQGNGADALRSSKRQIDTFEPFPNKWLGKTPVTTKDSSTLPSNHYDGVVSFNVLNVLPPDIRKEAIQEIGRTLRPGGIAHIVVRSPSSVRSAVNKRPAGEKNAYYIDQGNGKETYQVGFNKTDIAKEFSSVLGDNIEVLRTKDKLGDTFIQVKKLKATPSEKKAPNTQTDPEAIQQRSVLDVVDDLNQVLDEIGLKKPLMADVADYFSRRSQRLGKLDELTEENARALGDTLFVEAVEALSRDQDAIGWYDRKMDEALRYLYELHPEMESDVGLDGLFKAVLAITSNGQDIRANFNRAEFLYTHYKKTGEILTDSDWGGPSKGAINTGLATYADLVKQFGLEGARDFLMKEISIGDLDKVLKSYGLPETNGELKSHKVLGSVVFGPKIGSFFGNLNKRFDSITMDRWFMRTVNRVRGTLTDPPAKGVKNQIDRLTKALKGKRVGALRKDLQKIYKAVDKPGFKIDDYPETRQWLKQTYRAIEKRKFKNRTEAEMAAQRLHLYVTSLNQSPSNGGERAWIRGAMRHTQKRLLEEKGIDITNADLQAVLWYWEKDIYEKLGIGNKSGVRADYADAARELLEQNRRGPRGRRDRSGTTPATKPRTTPEPDFRLGEDSQRSSVITEGEAADQGLTILYHGTTKEGAKKISSEGKLRPEAEPAVYLTTDPKAGGYGDGTVVRLAVDPSRIEIDDEFPDGRQDFRAEVGYGKSLPVKLVEPEKPRVVSREPLGKRGEQVTFSDGSRATRASKREHWRIFDASGALLRKSRSLETGQ